MTKQHSPSKSDEVFEKALKLFVEKGVKGTSMRDLANATNLTTAGLYYYVNSKDDLINEVDRRLFEEVNENVFSDELAKLEPKARFHKFLESWIGLIIDRQELISVLREKVSSESAAAQIRERRKSLIKRTEDFLNGIRRDSKCDSTIDTTVAVFIVISIINLVPQWFKKGGRISEEELLQSIATFFMRGFLTRKR